VCIDGELALEDPEGAIALSVERSRRGVVIEYQGLAGGGLVVGQGCLVQRSGARRTIPSLRWTK
jgi:hypothetical protein